MTKIVRGAAVLGQRAALSGAALALTACGVHSLVVEHDEPAAIENSRSYAIVPGSVVTDHAVTAVPDQLVQDRINASLDEQLAARGFRQADPSEADLIVSYSASTRQRQEVVDQNRVEPWPFASGDVWIQDYREAKLTVEVREASEGASVFRATATDMNKDFRDPEFVASIVDKAMSEFPVE
jgi:hypothetical protein